MRELYRQDLAQIGIELDRMGNGVARSIRRATTALREGDLALAEQTIDADDRLNQEARAIDEMCVNVLALQAPVASDLRLVVAALRLSGTMERQGSLARHVAGIARSTFPHHSISARLAPFLDRMSDLACQMADLQARLVISHDLALAEQMMDLDDLLDDVQVDLRRCLADERNQLEPNQIIQGTLAGRFLERFGDHAVAAAHRITYIVQGDQRPQPADG